MKFFVDAQISFRLVKMLQNVGYDVLHTDDLPDKEYTTDTQIRDFIKIEN